MARVQLVVAVWSWEPPQDPDSRQALPAQPGLGAWFVALGCNHGHAAGHTVRYGSVQRACDGRVMGRWRAVGYHTVYCSCCVGLAAVAVAVAPQPPARPFGRFIDCLIGEGGSAMERGHVFSPNKERQPLLLAERLLCHGRNGAIFRSRRSAPRRFHAGVPGRRAAFGQARNGTACIVLPGGEGGACWRDCVGGLMQCTMQAGDQREYANAEHWYDLASSVAKSAPCCRLGIFACCCVGAPPAASLARFGWWVAGRHATCVATPHERVDCVLKKPAAQMLLPCGNRISHLLHMYRTVGCVRADTVSAAGAPAVTRCYALRRVLRFLGWGWSGVPLTRDGRCPCILEQHAATHTDTTLTTTPGATHAGVYLGCLTSPESHICAQNRTVSVVCVNIAADHRC